MVEIGMGLTERLYAVCFHSPYQFVPVQRVLRSGLQVFASCSRLSSATKVRLKRNRFIWTFLGA